MPTRGYIASHEENMAKYVASAALGTTRRPSPGPLLRYTREKGEGTEKNEQADVRLCLCLRLRLLPAASPAQPVASRPMDRPLRLRL